MNHPKHCHRSDLLFVLLVVLMLVVSLVVPAAAGLPEAHQQALAVYKNTKDPDQAVKVPEDPGFNGGAAIDASFRNSFERRTA